MTTSMRAFVLTRYGGPESAELRDVEVPRPAAREVLVKVRAAGLNPVDYKIRQGMLRVIRRYPLPIALGNELAGTALACGEGVGRFVPGDGVFARVDKDRLGAFAEYACVHEDLLAKLPTRLDAETAAGVP